MTTHDSETAREAFESISMLAEEVGGEGEEAEMVREALWGVWRRAGGKGRPRAGGRREREMEMEMETERKANSIPGGSGAGGGGEGGGEGEEEGRNGGNSSRQKAVVPKGVVEPGPLIEATRHGAREAIGRACQTGAFAPFVEAVFKFHRAARSEDGRGGGGGGAETMMEQLLETVVRMTATGLQREDHTRTTTAIPD